LCVAGQLMISHCGRMFHVEYTCNGTAIVTADLLGLDSRYSVVEHSAVLTESSGNQDLIGLDLGTRPSSRHLSLSRPKPAARQSTNRAGIVDEVQPRRDAIIFRDSTDTDSTSLNGDAPVNASDKSSDETGTVEHRPVAARRAVRSSSFDSRMSTSSAAAPVPPPKPNRQRAALNTAVLCSRIEELTSRLNSTADERDAAVAKVAELESKLNKYRDLYGDID